MDLQQGVRARLIASAAVRAIAATRVSWMTRAKGAPMPAITLQVISDPRPAHLKGLEGARSTRVRVDCWAESYSDALGLARAAIAVLVPPATISGKRFGNGQVVGQQDLAEDLTDGKFIHRQAVDIIIRHVGD